jgi:general secretion pathway protein F
VVTLLIYPAIVLAISLLISLVMLTQIVPRIGTALEGAGVTLPWFTRAMLVVGVAIRDHWVLALLATLALVAGAVFSRRALGAMLWRFARATPLLREVLLVQESARFFTVMAAMTRSGITLGDALGVAVGVLGHPVLRGQLQSLRTRLIEGGVLRHLIDTVSALPLPTRRLLIAAERAGDLESAFDTLAGDLTEELDRRTSRLLAAIEPALIVLLFLIVGSLLLAIMIPLMKSTSQFVG